MSKITQNEIDQKINAYNETNAQVLILSKRTSKTYWICDPNNNHFLVTGLKAFCKNNNLHISNMCDVVTGIDNSHKGWICRLVDENNQIIKPNKKSVSNSRKYWIRDPNGKEMIISNLNKFCKEQNIDNSIMCKIAKGKFKQHKGWLCKYIENDKIVNIHIANINTKLSKKEIDKKINEYQNKLVPIRDLTEKNSKKYWMCDPYNNHFLVSKIESFCKNKNLDLSAMKRIASGKQNSYKGWICRSLDNDNEIIPFVFRTILSKEDIIKKINAYTNKEVFIETILPFYQHRNIKQYWVCDPNNKHYLVTGIDIFCKNNNIDVSVMHKIASGKVKSYKGWVCRLVNNNKEIIGEF